MTNSAIRRRLVDDINNLKWAERDRQRNLLDMQDHLKYLIEKSYVDEAVEWTEMIFKTGRRLNWNRLAQRRLKSTLNKAR